MKKLGLAIIRNYRKQYFNLEQQDPKFSGEEGSRRDLLMELCLQ